MIMPYSECATFTACIIIERHLFVVLRPEGGGTGGEECALGAGVSGRVRAQGPGGPAGNSRARLVREDAGQLSCEGHERNVSGGIPERGKEVVLTGAVGDDDPAAG